MERVDERPTQVSTGLPRGARAGTSAVPISPAETIATYDELAEEYDLASHETTRGLEEASLSAFAAARRLIELCGGSSVLELGCGSGLLTGELVGLTSVGEIVASDPSPGMLAAATRKLNDRRRTVDSIVLTCATAKRALLTSAPVDLVVGSLADPFLDEALPHAVSTRLKEDGYAFFSVPSHHWATAERSGRLGIPLGITQFRTCRGRELYARSETYDVAELRGLFGTPGLDVVGGGFVRGRAVGERPVPEVVWVLAKRSSLQNS